MEERSGNRLTRKKRFYEQFTTSQNHEPKQSEDVEVNENFQRFEKALHGGTHNTDFAKYASEDVHFKKAKLGSTRLASAIDGSDLDTWSSSDSNRSNKVSGSQQRTTSGAKNRTTTNNARSVSYDLQHNTISSDKSISFPTCSESGRSSKDLVRRSATKRASGATSPKIRHACPIDSTLCVTFDDYIRTQNEKKQKDIIKLAKPEHLFFQGLCFLFIPNNDVSKPRRHRIRKSLEHGAVWAKDFGPFVTHIIADGDLTVTDVLRSINLERIPPTVHLVKDSYVPWCIEWRRAMSPWNTMHAMIPLSMAKGDEVNAKLPSSSPNKANLNQARTTPNSEECTVPGNGIGLDENNLTNSCNLTPSDPLTEFIEVAKLSVQFGLETDKDEGFSDDKPEVNQSQESVASDASLSTTQEAENEKSLSTTVPNWQRSFTCMSGGIDVASSGGPNKTTIEILKQMSNYYGSVQDQWRTLAYRKAISALKRQTKYISTKAEAEAVPGIGTRIAAKIEEIVTTSRLRRLQETKDSPIDQALSLFYGIYGVGHQQAAKWVQRGFRTIQDVVNNETLTENQKIGVKHFDDFQSRIPRAEVEECGKVVEKALLGLDQEFQVTLGGSYRRGCKDSGDIDLIITRPSKDLKYIRAMVLDRLVPLLFSQGFLTATLAEASKDNGTKWHGACKLHNPAESDGTGEPVKENPWRRIDFLLVPYEEIGAAMLYFTGNDIFNRSMRLLARRKGMMLNQRGLYKDILRGSSQERLNEGVLVESRDERRIFDILGVPWREPHERNY